MNITVPLYSARQRKQLRPTIAPAIQPLTTTTPSNHKPQTNSSYKYLPRKQYPKISTDPKIQLIPRYNNPKIQQSQDSTNPKIQQSQDSFIITIYKFKIWDMSNELNKVITSFIRQILGVHKKTTNLAIMAETGKLPISLKVFSHIMKYWMRISISKNSLLRQSYLVNCSNHEKGKRSWVKLVQFLLKYTNTNPHLSSMKDIDSGIKTFKIKLQQEFHKWWKSQAVVTGSNKLDFYYKYKKCFSFEKYLDCIPKMSRIHITRLRLSCHPFPIETGRYSKKAIKRADRICKICNTSELGDEEHYLRRCGNSLMEITRNKFLLDIKQKCPQMASFSNDNIIDYCILMNDPVTQLPMAIYTKEIMETFSEINNLQPKSTGPIITRSGRQVKNPDRLDL